MTQQLFTHNGLFHADEVFATALLSIMCNDDIEVIRGGDEDIPEDKDSYIIYDVGGGALDHHTPENKENNGTHPGTNIPYASLGLIWKKYYHEILSAYQCPKEYMEAVYTRLERSLILDIDGADNGFDIIQDDCTQMPSLQDSEVRRLVADSNMTFSVSKIIKDFNPSWNSDQNPDEAFKDALSFAKDILYNRLNSIMDSLDGRDYILQHIDYSAGHLMVLDHFAPWQGIVTSLSKNDTKAKDLWYVVAPALRGGWNIQCVLDSPDDRTSYRHPLPSSWYGLRAEQLQSASGVKDAKFCHPSGFLAGADSEQGALEMADIAIRTD